jgi:hypothetical protein
MKYSGRWHTESQTENIIAVGVYYLDIDHQVEGGSLQFRPKHFIIQILQQWNQKRLPEFVIEYILKLFNLSSIWETKEFRTRFRWAMLGEKTGWG